MRLFSWMQNKLNGKHGNKSQDTTQTSYHVKHDTREEFSDWPHGLFAIGTFGNNEFKENSEPNTSIQEESSISEHIQYFTPEEVGELKKELTKLLSKKPKAKVEKQNAELPLDRFLNCPSSLEVDRRFSNVPCDESDDKHEDIENTISVILGRCKEICLDKSKKPIGKKSLSILLKKIFVCNSGFVPAPSLRNTIQESRMEKLLRRILHKKINPQQSTTRATSVKKHIEDRQAARKQNEDEGHEKIDDGCKWVKTDSEYIVLEI